MNRQSHVVPTIRLSHPHDPPNATGLEVGMESFFEFCFWIAEELDDLVACQQWKESQRLRPLPSPSVTERPASFHSDQSPVI